MDEMPYEVSAQFAQMTLARILELELGAARDEEVVPLLESDDHRRRQCRLVAEQRAEAERMRTFLKVAQIRRAKQPREV